MSSRREFLFESLGAAMVCAASAQAAAPKRKFQLRYAPHFGMFKAHAGDDLVAQLEFMAAQGFTALEDNGLMGRPVDVQEKIGETLARLGMTMGVFVIDGGDNWKTSLATGKAEFREKFLDDLPHGGGSGQTRECELGDGGAGLLRTQTADRHPDRQRHRHAARRRGDPRASQPHDGARAAVATTRTCSCAPRTRRTPSAAR